MGGVDWLSDGAARRAEAGLHRTLTPRAADDGVLDLAGNDYLGLARHPDVVAAGIAAMTAYGAGSTGSRLVTGTTELHAELEDALAAFAGAESALVYSSGYLANLGAVTALAGPDCLVVSDERNHASLVDACRLARSQIVVTPHLDVDAVQKVLADRVEERALVVADAVFSVDGDVSPLAELHAMSRAHGAVLIVDEAHALGVVGADGRGLCALAGIAGESDVVQTVTLSKSLGSQGGAVVGSRAVRDHLVDTSRPFIFDTALAPASVSAALAALRLVSPERVADVRAAAKALASALGVVATAGAFVRVEVGDPVRAVAARDACLAEGVRVGCFRPPSVPSGEACLRITARADLTADDIVRAVDVVRRSLA